MPTCRRPSSDVSALPAKESKSVPVSGAVAFVLKGYPRLSETFIAHEIRALERRGLDIRIVSLRRPTDRSRHPVHREVKAPVLYLPEYLYREPIRVWRGWLAARKLRGYRPARRTWLRDLVRNPTPNRVRRFGQALVLVRELPASVTHLHAHFLHTPASVARYASAITGLPWSCSAHARDIWTTPAWEKREKLAACEWTVTCTSINCEHLRALAPVPDRVQLLYHGLDLSRFPLGEGQRPPRDGRPGSDPVLVLSVGRAVEKKGYADLLHALAALAPTLRWQFVHIGGGPLLPRLKARARALGLADKIMWLGAQPHDVVMRWYREADLFVLACCVARDGDRDGMPNVLLEAQSQGLACVTTRLSGIPELIEDGVTGVLTPPHDRGALSAALARLISDPQARQRFGKAGRQRVAERFSFDAGIERLAGSLQLATQGSPL